MSTQHSEEDTEARAVNYSKKRGRRGSTKKPSYMAEGKFVCGVCESPNPTGYHYGKITCEGCKGFFKRVVQVSRGSSLKCKNSGQCLVGRKDLTKCAFCRYAKCLQIGMDPDLVKVGSILVAWNQKKKENKKKRERLKGSRCDSGEDTSMAADHSNEESLNHSETSISTQKIEPETPKSVDKRPQNKDFDGVEGMYHYDAGVNAFIHFTNFASLANDALDRPKLSRVKRSDDREQERDSVMESIIINFKNIVGSQNKSQCQCGSLKDAEDMLRSCIYRSSWMDFFLAFDDLCQLDEDVINDTVLESVSSCQTFFTIATGLMPNGQTLKLENDSEVMVIPVASMEDPSFSVFQSMLLLAQTSIVKSLTTEDVAIILMLIAVNLGKEISRKRNREESHRQLENIDRKIIGHLRDNRSNDSQTYQTYKDLITICIMISCQVDNILT